MRRHRGAATAPVSGTIPRRRHRRARAYPYGVYRFLGTPRWLGVAALALFLAAVMVMLGNWQLDRYHQKVAINDRIDGAARADPVPVGTVLRTGQAPPADAAYTRVTATGRYDVTHEILVRGRTLDGRVGFEVLTPLVLDSGAAVLVDRGWVPPARGGSTLSASAVPAPPGGVVSVTGAVRLSERPIGRVERRDGRLEARGIAAAQLAGALPYPLLDGYVTIRQDGLKPIEAEHVGTLQNAGYAVQWWAFAALTLFGYGYLARRQARGDEAGEAGADLVMDRLDREEAPA
jgi:cytochrome oxidase assembly protein ShyY1